MRASKTSWRRSKLFPCVHGCTKTYRAYRVKGETFRVVRTDALSLDLVAGNCGVDEVSQLGGCEHQPAASPEQLNKTRLPLFLSGGIY